MPSLERRLCHRLELAIPIFITGKNLQGRQFTELATALNVSAGGVLVLMQNRLVLPGRVKLKIPVPPLPDGFNPESLVRGNIDAKIIRTEQRNNYQLAALQFVRPMQTHATQTLAVSVPSL